MRLTHPLALIFLALLTVTSAIELQQVAKLPGVSSHGFNTDQSNDTSKGGIDSEKVATKSPVQIPLTYSGDKVCDVYATNVTNENLETVKDNFDIDFFFYVSINPTNDSNYYLDYILKNPNFNTNSFYLANFSDNINDFHPIYISNQGAKGFEIRFNLPRNQLCSILYSFYIFYGLANNQYNETSHKVFLSGSCDMTQAYFSSEYNLLINQGYRCVNYNSGYNLEGQAWCYNGYIDSECCASYDSDILISNVCSINSSQPTLSTLTTSTTVSTVSTPSPIT